MALDLEHLKAAVDSFHTNDPDVQEAYAVEIEMAIRQLRAALPALTEDDLAAVAYYIATVLAAFRSVPLQCASDVLTDTAVAHSLGAAQLLGMLP